jgi:hypothetical protein
MKKIIFLFGVVFLFTFSVNLFAEGGKFSFWGGYTTVKMDDINDSLEQRVKTDNEEIAEVIENADYYGLDDVSGKASADKLKNGFIIGVDYLAQINENMKIGGRFAFLNVTDGKFNVDYKTIKNNYDGSGGIFTLEYYEKQVYEASLMPIMVGTSHSYSINERFTLNGKIFAGIGFVSLKWRTEYSAKETYSNDPTLDETESDSSSGEKYTGCFVTDISIGAEYSFTEKFGLGFDLGYRFTPKTEVDETGLVKVDFSGVTTKLSLNYKF